MIMMPPKYASETNLDDFLKAVLMAYPNVVTVLDLMIDGLSDEYKAFHILSTRDHVTMVHVRQFGITYQVSRVSNLRHSTGYVSYTKSHWDTVLLQEDERIVTYRSFIDKWLPWRTVKL